MKRELINCPKCKKGILFNITSLMAQVFNVFNYECDLCHAKYAKKNKEE